MELTENDIFYLFATNGKLPIVFCKQKTEDCFPWSANDKQKSTFAVSTNVLICDYTCTETACSTVNATLPRHVCNRAGGGQHLRRRAGGRPYCLRYTGVPSYLHIIIWVFSIKFNAQKLIQSL